MSEFGRTHARSTDPATSRAAAESLDPKNQLRVFEDVFLRAYPEGLTAEQAALRTPYGTSNGNYTKRVSDLINQGRVEPTGETRPGSSGRKQRVLRYVPEANREGRLL